jgi:hypothetical protein
MYEGLWSKMRRFLIPRKGFMFPERVTTRVATWWQWGGRTYRVRRHDGRDRPPTAPAHDTRAPDG